MMKATPTTAELKKLRKILRDIPEDRKPIAESLFQELVFMQEVLTTLKTQVLEEGPTALFKQGKQEFIREHPAMKAYNTTIQRYSLLYRQIEGLFPDTKKAAPQDDLMKFIKK